MKERKNFWDRNAKIYDRFMRKDRAAYAQMYELLRPIVRHKTVLELATGTGLVAKNIVNAADHIEATDASEEMICQAKRDNTFTHAENGLYGKIRAFAMKLVGFPLHSRWTSGGYLAFLRKNGWMVHKSMVLKASFPLTYVECRKGKAV